MPSLAELRRMQQAGLLGHLGSPLSQTARLVDEEEDDGIFTRAFDFLGRPAFAFRSLLRGDFAGVVQNAARFGMDLATLDPIHGMAPDLLTIDAPKPEATDVLKAWGFDTPSGPWGKLGVDLIGGILTDPLTLVTGPAGIGKGALTGASKSLAGARLMRALERTDEGKRALTAAAKSLQSQLIGPQAPGLRARAALDVFGAKLDPASKAELLGLADDALTGAGHLAGTKLDAGVEALEQAGLIQRNTWKFAGKDTGLYNPWRATLPGFAAKHGPAPVRNMLQMSEDFAQAGFNRLASEFYDKTYSGVIPKGFQAFTRQLASRKSNRDAALQDDVKRLWGEDVLKKDQREIIGTALMKESDLVVSPYNADGTHYLLHPDEWDITKQADIDDAWAHAESEALSALPTETHDAVKAGFKRYRKDMDDYHDELVKLGVLEKDHKRQLYIPHQAINELAEKIGGSPGTEKFRGALNGVYALRRKHTKLDDFLDALDKHAQQYGITSPAHENLPLAARMEDLVETDIGLLHLRRGLAHHRTAFQRELDTKAHSVGLFSLKAPVDRYLKKQFEGLGERGVIQSFFQGGNPLVTLPDGNKYHLFAGEGFFKGLAPVKAGEKVKAWKGLNYYYKPALTVFFPAFHGRNFLSAIAMSTLDPDIGIKEGMRAAGIALKEAPIAHILGTALGKKLPGTARGGVLSEPGIAKLLRALRSPDEAALTALATSKEFVGEHSLLEVYKGAIGAVVHKHMGPHDLALALDRLDTLKHGGLASQTLAKAWDEGAGEAAGFVYRRVLNAVMAIGDHVEDSFRLTSYVSLLKKGFTPGEAAHKVGKAYVDYGMNSSSEVTARALMPFFAFSRGITPVVLKQMATRPGSSQWIGTTQRSLKGGAGSDSAFLPEEVRRGLGVPSPLGGDDQYVTGLGLPHEAAFDSLSPLNGFDGMRQFLGNLHPAISSPLEQTVGVDFWRGRPVGDRTWAPNWLKLAGDPGVQRSVNDEGKVMRRVPGWVNDLLSALPTSRLGGTIDKLMTDDEVRPITDRLLNVFTGLRTVKVDQRRAALKRLGEYFQAAKDRGEAGKIERFFASGDSVPPELKLALGLDRAIRREMKEDR